MSNGITDGHDYFTSTSEAREWFYQFDKRSNFQPRVHLIVLADHRDVTDRMSVLMTELSHKCLYTYFYPHGDAVSVSWKDRKTLYNGIVERIQNNERICAVDTLDELTRFEMSFTDARAILFLCAEAEAFRHRHSLSFLETLAVSLRTKPEAILHVNMEHMPRDL
ncbi:hypothetical protein MAR_025347 [Mya arenaria]|uniref:MEDS domain-containing protein n=1 Tax=Mya arenaria TaxID=6604 RepID=A0ABY7DU50_MYAAR|nr:uncharacterized protein LOC128226408 [Mya arenaria]WAR00975.1 hypothetical protein MAR_025347 [Mya arenaria]